MTQNTIQNQPAAALPEAAEAAGHPAELAGKAVLQAIGEALPVLEQETEVLRTTPRLDVLKPLTESKEVKLEAYQRAVLGLRNLPGGRQNLPDALRKDLLDAARGFEDAMRRNAKALDIALITSRKVMDAIMGAARTAKGSVEVYGRRGGYVTPGGVAPVAVDRAL